MLRKILGLLVASMMLTLIGCAGTATDAQKVAKPEVKQEAKSEGQGKSVKQIVEEAKFEIVNYEYVKNKLGDQLRKFNQLVVIDARPVRKYDAAHIPSAINIPDTHIDKYFPQLEKFKVAKDTEIIVYCGGFYCIKSYNVAKFLRDKGYTNVKIYLAGDPEYSTKSFMEISLSEAEKLHKEGVLFIDARPELVYKKGTIPGAINIPDTKFSVNQEPYMKLLPNDKNTKMVVFCGGYACVKSHIVAEILYNKGYKNVVVYAGGEPEWKENGKPIVIPGQEGAAVQKAEVKQAAATGDIKPGKDEGTVDKEFFKTFIDSRPDNIVIIDVRTPSEFVNGHVKGAINIPVDDMYKKGCESVTSRLPKGKNIIFMCASGARAGEMWYGLKDDCKYDMKGIYFLDAKVDYSTGKCEIK
ncbi:MAG: sulfurtransferase [Deferribacterales bacterium]